MGDYNYGPFEHELAGGTFAKPDRRGAMPPVTTCDKCGLAYYQTSAPHICAEWTKGRTEHEPVARGGEGEQWGYVETSTTAEIRIGEITLRPHWTGLADGSEIRRLLKQGTDAVNQHHALLAERERLREALRRVRHAYNQGPEPRAVRSAMDEAIDYVDEALNEQGRG